MQDKKFVYRISFPNGDWGNPTLLTESEAKEVKELLLEDEALVKMPPHWPAGLAKSVTSDTSI